MQQVLVDTPVWIDYFGGGARSAALDALIDDNLVVTNELILAELLPYLKLRRQLAVVGLLETLRRLPLLIDWQDIIAMQVRCLRSGANGVGIPDLVIAQNALSGAAAVYSLDEHFQLIKRVCPRLGVFA